MLPVRGAKNFIIPLLSPELARLSAKVFLSFLLPWPSFSQRNKLSIFPYQLYGFFPSGLYSLLLPGMPLAHPSPMLKPLFRTQFCCSPQETFLDPQWRVRHLFSVLLLHSSGYSLLFLLLFIIRFNMSLFLPVWWNTEDQEPCPMHLCISRTCHAVWHKAVNQQISVDWLSAFILEWVHNSSSAENDHPWLCFN